jgi:hypothetical protein
MARIAGVVLAAPLIALLAALGVAAAADGECVTTPTGIECGYGGTSTSTSVAPGTTLPLRYLGTSSHFDTGPCWYWSTTPPGLDSWDPANDQAIIFTRLALPECPTRETPPTVIHTSAAWEIFRSFPLAAPTISFDPAVGITNLASFLASPAPDPITHTEVLPDGTVLEVRAEVVTAWVDWGDGSPEIPYPPEALRGHPHGSATHAYALKTCRPSYRLEHPSGGNCHPTLPSYVVRVTWEWAGRFRQGGEWIDLGTIDRRSVERYDVDEVVGVLR